MSVFVFDSYGYDHASGEAVFSYRFEGGRSFTERVRFPGRHDTYDEALLDRVLRLAFYTIGTSYLKTDPTPDVSFTVAQPDAWQAAFLNNVYQEGMSQFAFENGLTREQLPHIEGRGDGQHAVPYDGEGILALQSGGKDSLLSAQLLSERGVLFTPWYISSNESDAHPRMLDDLGEPLVIAHRFLDRQGLAAAKQAGGRDGHVPVTYIVLSIALVQAVLLGKAQVLASIAHEGEEPHAWIGDLGVNHQWAKTWAAEQLLSEYVARYISPDIRVGSPLRAYSELRVAELFAQHAWGRFGKAFSSCNLANYKQGTDNTVLQWCGVCPKCANAFLLFAPFIDASELRAIFAGEDLFENASLQETFKGLLGVGDVMKPFECVGEIDELRFAYAQSQQKGGYGALSFDVPASEYDYMREYPSQEWARL